MAAGRSRRTCIVGYSSLHSMLLFGLLAHNDGFLEQPIGLKEIGGGSGSVS